MVVGTEPLQYNFSREGAEVSGSGERSKAWSSVVAKTILVGPDIEKGAKILRILDDAGLKVSVALWAFLAEYEDWRFILSGRKFDAAGLKGGYGLLHDTLDAAGFSLEDTPIVGIFRSSDPFIRSLRKAVGKTKSVDGMRLGGQTFGNRSVEDAYAYRIS
jgi:hypothetical protein